MSSLSHYDALGVRSDATAFEIRKAYRAAALKHHPDKNPGNRKESEFKFIAVAAAYEVLSDERKRAAYDRGSSDQLSGSRNSQSPFDFQSASRMFRENFGEALANDWRPGMRIAGTLVRDGKRVTLTINPDGSSDEKEEVAMKNEGQYSFVTQSSPNSMHVQFTGSVGQAFADYLLPPTVTFVPAPIRPALAFALSWLPAGLCSTACLSCCWICCCGR